MSLLKRYSANEAEKIIGVSRNLFPLLRKVAVYATDMNTEVQCAECGKKMKYGEGYTSRWIHTEHGFGYCVCEQCYNIELSTEMKLRGL